MRLFKLSLFLFFPNVFWCTASSELGGCQKIQEPKTSAPEPQSKGSESSAKEVKVPAEERCLARDASKEQCKFRRHHPKFLCGLHQRILEQKGELDHGWITDKEDSKHSKNSKSSKSKSSVPHGSPQSSGPHGPHGIRSDAAIRMHSSKPIKELKPMAAPEEAPQLVQAMRNVPSEATSMRLGLLLSLNNSPRHCMFSFVQAGGVEILSKWLRLCEEARHACLMVLQKLPVTEKDLQKAGVIPLVEAIQNQDEKEVHRTNATALIERWKAAGFIEEPAAKRQRREAPPAAPAAAAAAAAAPAQPVPQPQMPGSQPRTPPLETLPGARRENIPQELQRLDPRIAQVLMDRPGLHAFLQKLGSCWFETRFLFLVDK